MFFEALKGTQSASRSTQSNMSKRTLGEAENAPSMDVDEFNDDDEHQKVVRFKWMGDGCASVDQIIERLHQEISYYTQLKYEGWELRGPIQDDWGFMHKTEAPSDPRDSVKKHRVFETKHTNCTCG